MSTAVLTLEGLKSINFDESAVINNETFPVIIEISKISAILKFSILLV